MKRKVVKMETRSAMRTSPHGISLLQEWEATSLVPYRDAAGYWTIGTGHLITGGEQHRGTITIAGKAVPYAHGIKPEQAQALLAQDLIPREEAVSRSVMASLVQHQFDALVSFVFNVGVWAFLHGGPGQAPCNVLRAIHAGKFDHVPDALRKWVKAGGRVLPGLVNRRENEIMLWMGRI